MSLRSTSQPTLHFLPSLQGQGITQGFLQKIVSRGVKGGEVRAGRTSDMADLLRYAKASEEQIDEIQFHMNDQDRSHRGGQILSETVSALSNREIDDQLSILALSPEAQIYQSPTVSAQYIYTSYRGNFRTFHMGSSPWLKKGETKKQIKSEMEFRRFVGVSQTSNLLHGALLLKPQVKGGDRVIGSVTNLVDQFFHEATHYADLELFRKWVAANQSCLERGEEPDALFQDYALVVSGMVYVSSEFYGLVSEIRAYFISAYLMKESRQFHKSAFSEDEIDASLARIAFHDLSFQGARLSMERFGITQENFFDHTHTFTDRMKETINECEIRNEKQ